MSKIRPSAYAEPAANSTLSQLPELFMLGKVSDQPVCNRFVCCLQWVVYDPEGRKFPVVADASEYADMIGRMAGPDAVAQWKRLEAAMAPLQRGAALFPAAAIRCGWESS